ncbi:hypothetical protein NXS19_000411 [Fusarium pseudograminearum]|nr:hypothetical protein NXS19_000411 [Fusarium pseudograminearum]
MPSQVTATPFAPRFKRYQAFDADLDKDALNEARSWGQHVNKTETKAITAYPVGQLLSILPKSLHPSIRKSKYYTSTNDSLTFQAQDSRSRDANADDNRRKLTDEVMRMYKEATPAETSVEKRKKHEEIGKKFHESRMKQKKFTSAKKQSRRGPST